eukprot:scaffold135471_cov31-Tisochrysis_lutea.AAC.3
MRLRHAPLPTGDPSRRCGSRTATTARCSALRDNRPQDCPTSPNEAPRRYNTDEVRSGRGGRAQVPGMANANEAARLEVPCGHIEKVGF